MTYIVYIEKNSRKIPKKFPGIYYIYTIQNEKNSRKNSRNIPYKIEKNSRKREGEGER